MPASPREGRQARGARRPQKAIPLRVVDDDMSLLLGHDPVEHVGPVDAVGEADAGALPRSRRTSRPPGRLAGVVEDRPPGRSPALDAGLTAGFPGITVSE
jgi:hypothetical protein